MVVECLRAGRGSAQQLAEVVQCLGLAQVVAEVAVLLEGLLVAGGGCQVIAGQLLHETQFVEGVGLPAPVTDVAEQCRDRCSLAAAAS